MHFLRLPTQCCVFFPVTLLMPYCLLAFNDSFLGTLFLMLSFQMLYFYVEIIIIFFKIILYATLNKYRFPISSPKDFLHHLVRLTINW